jgi:micrococcal nuclease
MVRRSTRRSRSRRPPTAIRLPGPIRRHPAVAILLLLLLGLGVLDRGLRSFARSDDYGTYHNQVFTVSRVIDGDTFDIPVRDGRFPTTRIRLWGVDAPEKPGGKREAMHFGQEATDYATQTLTDQRVRLVLSPDHTRGKYGRLLAYAYLEPDGDCFNELLLENGYAYADHRFDHPHKAKYATLEQAARRQGLGLWANVTPDQMPPWKQPTRTPSPGTRTHRRTARGW